MKSRGYELQIKTKILKVTAPGGIFYAVFRKEDGTFWSITHCMSELKWMTKYDMLAIQRILKENDWNYEWLKIDDKSINVSNIPRV